MTSRLPGFYKKPPLKRREIISDKAQIHDEGIFSASVLSLERAELMIENVIGTFALPIGVAVNFCINNTDRLIPMVVEEPSIVAAVSNMARLLRPYGGFTAASDASVMIGQIQVLDVNDINASMQKLTAIIPTLMAQADLVHPRLKERGGGMKDIHIRHIRYDEPGERPQDMIVVHFLLDCVDAMGANMVNTIAEKIAPIIQNKLSCRIGLKILSNYATQRLSKAECCIPVEALSMEGVSGKKVAQGIVEAYQFAYADPWRAATHNKGIMNGIDAVALATGNDWRAIEAGAHAWASRSGQYRSLSKWWIKDEQLHGSLTLPIQVGTVGGPIKTQPQVAANLKILDNPRAHELSSIMAAVGLAQNMGALRALSTEGIQKGHMRMHARNIALQAGASTSEITDVVQKMSDAHHFSLEFAQQALAELRNL